MTRKMVGNLWIPDSLFGAPASTSGWMGKGREARGESRVDSDDGIEWLKERGGHKDERHQRHDVDRGASLGEDENVFHPEHLETHGRGSGSGAGELVGGGGEGGAAKSLFANLKGLPSSNNHRQSTRMASAGASLACLAASSLASPLSSSRCCPPSLPLSLASPLSSSRASLAYSPPPPLLRGVWRDAEDAGGSSGSGGNGDDRGRFKCRVSHQLLSPNSPLAVWSPNSPLSLDMRRFKVILCVDVFMNTRRTLMHKHTN